MELLQFLALILFGILGGTGVSTLKPDLELYSEDSITDLRQKLADMEIRLSRLEEKEISDLELKDELPLKMQEIEKKTLENRDEILRKVAGVEMGCIESTAELLGKLQNAENRFLKVDSHLLMEIHEVQKKLSDTFEMVHSVKLELKNTLNEEKKKIENLQEKQNETRDALNSFLTSQRDNQDIILKILTSSAEELKVYIDDRLMRFENIQSHLAEKIRTIECSLLKLEDEFLFLGVSKQNETSRNLDRKELQDTHTQTTCVGEPPFLQNGRARAFERSYGSTVQYECYPDFVMTGNSTVRCELGAWEGQPPTCVFFDRTFVMECEPLAPDYFYCYSDENYRKIKLSRVLDTGRGEDLSKNTTERTDPGKYSFIFGDIEDIYSDRLGVFQCELNSEYGYMKILTVIQKMKYMADMTAPDPFKHANIGESVKLKVDLRRKLGIPVKWKHNGVNKPSWDGLVEVEIQNVQTTDAGIYECFYPEGRYDGRQALISLTVRNCKENFYGENCEEKCPPCYNGGICHDLLGICVCPAGFTGSNCEIACDGRHFGINCEKECHSLECRFGYFCKPHPYGCSCAPGYTGSDCRQKCDPGWYGSGCKQPCHCANGPSSCNIYNGVCTGGCSTGWTGQSCQIPVAAQQMNDDEDDDEKDDEDDDDEDDDDDDKDDDDDESDEDRLIWLYN